MSLSAFGSALLRRWYLTLGGAIAAIGLTVLIVLQIGPTYKAEGSVLLFPPTTTLNSNKNIETQGNPYLLLGGLTQARDIVIRTLESNKVQDDFAAKHAGATFEVTPDYTTSGPVLVFVVKSRDAAAATAGLKTVIAQVPAQLTTLQSGLNLSQAAQITSRTLTADAVALPVSSSQVRTGILVGAIVGLITLFLLALVDGLLTAQRRKQAARASEDPSRDDAEGSDTPVARHHRKEPATDEVSHESPSEQPAAGLPQDERVSSSARG